MKNPLSLHHVTVMDVGPAELISIASDLGCQHVCLFTHVAPEALPLFPCDWGSSTLKEVKSRCNDTGITAYSLEYFDVFPGIDLDNYRKGLEVGAELGAKCATTHVNDSDVSWAIDNFARFCDIAGEYGISPSIEFTSLAGPETLDRAVKIIAGANRSNGGVALDTLHLFRSGGSVDDIAKLDPNFLKSVQISDGPLILEDADAYGFETVFERDIPGEGEFPLRDLLKYIPENMVIDLEVPLKSLKEQGMSAVDRARLVVNATNKLLQL